MVRAPCCEKMGLKKGPWTAEEDEILINYIRLHGHSNWRALPKQAGLLRCGKSCRLRWINYLRPDIKRGNFTQEEEETIIKLHEMLGNRWSAIAARLPGRTDNEIKNVWHTHLKKRLIKKHQPVNPPKVLVSAPDSVNGPGYSGVVSSPQRSTSDDVDSTVTTSENNGNNIMSMKYNDLEGNLTEIDESFWSEVLSADNSEVGKEGKELEMVGGGGEAGIPLAMLERVNDGAYGSNLDDNNMDFWYNLLTRAGEILPEQPYNI